MFCMSLCTLCACVYVFTYTCMYVCMCKCVSIHVNKYAFLTPFVLPFLNITHPPSIPFLPPSHSPSLPSTPQHHNKQSTCAYCGMTELGVCSPLVVGQCRSEHEAHLELLREAAEAEIAAAAAAVKGRYSPVVRTFSVSARFSGSFLKYFKI